MKIVNNICLLAVFFVSLGGSSVYAMQQQAAKDWLKAKNSMFEGPVKDRTLTDFNSFIKNMDRPGYINLAQKIDISESNQPEMGFLWQDVLDNIHYLFESKPVFPNREVARSLREFFQKQPKEVLLAILAKIDAEIESGERYLKKWTVGGSQYFVSQTEYVVSYLRFIREKVSERAMHFGLLPRTGQRAEQEVKRVAAQGPAAGVVDTSKMTPDQQLAYALEQSKLEQQRPSREDENEAIRRSMQSVELAPAHGEGEGEGGQEGEYGRAEGEEDPEQPGMQR